MFRRTLALIALLFATAALSEDFRADPATYERLLRGLKPGDSLLLAPGTYRSGLTLSGIKGTAAAPIEIRGPSEGPPAIFVARPEHDTVNLSNTEFVHIRHLVLDGGGLPVDAVKASASKRCSSVHDIVLENLLIVGHGADQQVVGIASFCPAWNWTIRRNVIIGAGTGLYLGQSDGTAPFVAGVIEQNVIVDTRGYNLQIKHQIEGSRPIGMPRTPRKTVIRNNVFAKARNASLAEGARPNLLLGHFPKSGDGVDDTYEITRNLFYCNPTEALLQAEGNMDIRENILINPAGSGIAIQPHKDVPKHVSITRNFVAASERGISIVSASAAYEHVVAANQIFAAKPLAGGAQRGNATGPFSDAAASLLRWLDSKDGGVARRQEFGPLVDAATALCGPPNVTLTNVGGLHDAPASRRVCDVVRTLARSSNRVDEGSSTNPFMCE